MGYGFGAELDANEEGNGVSFEGDGPGQKCYGAGLGEREGAGGERKGG